MKPILHHAPGDVRIENVEDPPVEASPDVVVTAAPPGIERFDRRAPGFTGVGGRAGLAA